MLRTPKLQGRRREKGEGAWEGMVREVGDGVTESRQTDGERRQEWPTKSERIEGGGIRRLGAVLTSWRIIIQNSEIRLFGFKS